ncbi:MAG: hypothetical protein PHN55_08410, partial [Dysgonamonadaceae bacterium]|nr:hypothetical protein [Dysgonamonadaceae bacterium]
LSPKKGEIENENLQALFVSIIESKIVEVGADLFTRGEKANCGTTRHSVESFNRSLWYDFCDW